MTITMTPGSSEARSSPQPAPAPRHVDHARNIRVAVRARSRELRAKHPILAHQDALGAGILAASALGVVGTAVAYVVGAIAWWIAVPLAAVFMAIAHEIEHDAIHRLYFTRNKKAQHVMFAVVWLLRPYTISPWARRPLHLLHHDVSGTARDLEEKGITNGERWGVRRLVMMIDPAASVLFRLPADPAKRRAKLRFVAKAWFPLTFIALAVWYGFLALGLAHLVTGGAIAGSGALAVVLGALQVLTVVWIGPNVLRVACLHFISSNMHYYGDVEEGNVVEQTQVLNRWWLLPVQLFCCNFGSTHGIHHFVPGDPFYVRQMTAKAAHEVMRDNGVRFNDLGTFRRANRLRPTP
jgi:fatty acid desaturase